MLSDNKNNRSLVLIIFLGILAIGLVCFFIHLFTSKEPKTPLRIVELFLVYQLVFSVGLTSLLAFYGLTFMTDFVAAFSGWPTCPFAKLLGNVNLAFSVLGILCIWFRGNFWLATILGCSIWLLGDAVTHIIDMIVNHNYAPGNIGATLYTDILIPLVLLATYALYRILLKEAGSSNCGL